MDWGRIAGEHGAAAKFFWTVTYAPQIVDERIARTPVQGGCQNGAFDPAAGLRSAHARPVLGVQRSLGGASVAVGTVIAHRPPHRSRRALLTHRAPTSGKTWKYSPLRMSAVGHNPPVQQASGRGRFLAYSRRTATA